MHLNKVVLYWLTLLGDHSKGLYVFQITMTGKLHERFVFEEQLVGIWEKNS